MSIETKAYIKRFGEIRSRSHGTCIWAGIFAGGLRFSFLLVYPLRTIGALVFSWAVLAQLVVLLWQFADLRKLVKDHCARDKLEWSAETVWHWVSFLFAGLASLFVTSALMITVYTAIAGYCLLWAVFRGTKTYKYAEHIDWKLNMQGAKSFNEV